MLKHCVALQRTKSIRTRLSTDRTPFSGKSQSMPLTLTFLLKVNLQLALQSETQALQVKRKHRKPRSQGFLEIRICSSLLETSLPRVHRSKLNNIAHWEERKETSRFQFQRCQKLIFQHRQYETTSL